VTSRPVTGTSFRRFDIVLLALAALCTGGFYVWTVIPDPADSEVRHVAHKYFGLQAEGWLAGRLDLPRTVPAGLLLLPDPYDPEANRAFRMAGTEGVHDLSLHNGRLYLYWGPVPTLVAFLPWRVLTGEMLQSAWASWVFAFGAWCASAVLLARAARKYFPATRTAVLFAGYIGLAVCNWAPVVLRRATVWETPIFAACFFGTLTWWLLAECSWAERPAKWRWLAAASLAWGLAFGSRPIWIVASGVLLVPLWLERSRWREKEFRRMMIAAALPCGLCVLGLLAHNVARFGDPLEFGQRWQLADVRVQNARLFAPAYLGFNVHAYLLSVPRFVAYFPFILPAPYAVPPPGHFGTEMVYGLFVALPWLWFIVLTPRSANTAGVVAPVAITGLSLLGVLATFAGVTARYELEIALPLALLAALGLLAWEGRTHSLQWLGRIVWIAALTASAAITIAASCHYMGMYARTHPAAYRALARAANRLAVHMDWSPREGTEAVELTVVFPSSPAPGRQEALLASGSAPLIDVVFVEYLEAGDLRFIFFMSGQTAATIPLRVDRATSQLLRIELGGMLPPDTHPFWKNTPASEIAHRRSRIRVVLDGTEVSAGTGPQSEPVDAKPAIGDLPPDSAERFAFTGKILASRLVRVAPPFNSEETADGR
jgi:hypothetical protein